MDVAQPLLIRLAVWLRSLSALRVSVSWSGSEWSLPVECSLSLSVLSVYLVFTEDLCLHMEKIYMNGETYESMSCLFWGIFF